MTERYLGTYELDDEEFDSENEVLSSDDEPDDSSDNVGPLMGKEKTYTTASEVRRGKDIQGICWEHMNYTRSMYREIRLKQYENYVNLSFSRDALEKESKQAEKGSNFYDFQFNTREMRSTIFHFQLRNLVWATSKHDVYCIYDPSIMHWSPLFRRAKQVLNVAGKIDPEVKSSKSNSQVLSRVQVSALLVKDNMMVAGGLGGELVCKHLNRPGVAFCTKLCNDANAITNAVDLYRSTNGSTRLVAANNDRCVRVLDVGNYSLLSEYSFPWSVNNASVSPDGKIVAVLGDTPDCLLIDAQSGKTIGPLKGHLDYSFSSAWHPDGCMLATGNQDATCRVWDLRKTSHSFCVLPGRMAAIRTIKYSSDGKFLAMAEAEDFVHIFDTHSEYGKEQEIDIFGEIAGISFSPDTEALFVGVSHRSHGSLMEFNRRRHNGYLNSYA